MVRACVCVHTHPCVCMCLSVCISVSVCEVSVMDQQTLGQIAEKNDQSLGLVGPWRTVGAGGQLSMEQAASGGSAAPVL